MKFTLIIKKYDWGMGCSSRAKFLDPDFFNGKNSIPLIRNLEEKDGETNFVVCFTKTSPVALPVQNGIYNVELSDSASLWKDIRESRKYPTIRISTEEVVKFTKKADLKK